MKTTDRETILADFVLGSSQAITPEGYLLCSAVPIARTGSQQYLNEELLEGDGLDALENVEGGADGIIVVSRLEDDVFHPDTIASFQGKPVVNDHPDGDMLGPHNFRQYTVGTVLNVRRGEGSTHNLLLADLLIKDADAIAAVRAGKREVSCGYDAKYTGVGPGKARQHTIIGNHVALVTRGRCGGTCSIGDEDKTMKTADKKSVLDRIRGAFGTKDAKAFDEAMEELGGTANDAAPVFDPNKGPGVHVHLHGVGGTTDTQEETNVSGNGNEETTTKDEAPAWFKSAMDSLEERLGKLEGAKDKKGTKDESEEEDVTKEGEEEAEGGTMDADPDGDEDKEPTKDKKGTKDSAPLAGSFREVISDAEIIAPGLKLPTFDSATPAKATNDALCLHKRRALRAYAGTMDGAEVLTVLNGGKDKLDLSKMTCDALGVLFGGAVGVAKQRNKGGTLDLSRTARATGGAAGIPKTPAEFNRQVQDFYKNN